MKRREEEGRVDDDNKDEANADEDARQQREGVLQRQRTATANLRPMMGPSGEMRVGHYCPKLGTGIDLVFFFRRRGFSPYSL